MNNKKIAGIGLMIALAFLLGYIESLFPFSFGIPGIKLGLSNMVVVFALYNFSASVTIGVALIRILLVGLTFGNFSSLMYSMAGGVLSLLVMMLLKRMKLFTVYGVSMAGGVFHNVGQILVASVILQTGLLIYYLPFLLVAGILSGLAIGYVSGLIIKRLAALNLDQM